jgi:archaellum component FlaG (FlaF/FlaG flagellin family)
VSHGDVSVIIAPACAGQATEQDARLARRLADEAAAYAAEIERLAAASSPGDAAA